MSTHAALAPAADDRIPAGSGLEPVPFPDSLELDALSQGGADALLGLPDTDPAPEPSPDLPADLDSEALLDGDVPRDDWP